MNYISPKLMAILNASNEISKWISEILPSTEDGESELTTLRARVAALEAVLRLFADKATKWEANHQMRVGSRGYSNSTQVSHRLGDFRRARDVLEGTAIKGTRQ